MWAVKFLTILWLLLVFWEDLRYRAVHWSLFPALFLLLGTPAYIGQPRSEWYANSGFNLLFLVLQGIAMMALLALWRGTWANPVGRSVGPGDILFLLVVTTGLSAEHFVLYYVTGLALCLITYLTVVRWWPGQPQTVPTAGVMAAYLAGWLVLEQLGQVHPLHRGGYALLLFHG